MAREAMRGSSIDSHDRRISPPAAAILRLHDSLCRTAETRSRQGQPALEPGRLTPRPCFREAVPPANRDDYPAPAAVLLLSRGPAVPTAQLAAEPIVHPEQSRPAF